MNINIRCDGNLKLFERKSKKRNSNGKRKTLTLKCDKKKIPNLLLYKKIK